MARSLLLTLLFALTVPAFAKPDNEKKPIPCSELWTAVTETLGNAGDYKVVAIDSEKMKANFIVVGALFSQMERVQLQPRSNGCELQLRIGFTGADDEGAFRTRVKRAFKKLNAARTSAHSDSGQAQ
jgi:hypothetical protein